MLKNYDDIVGLSGVVFTTVASAYGQNKNDRLVKGEEEQNSTIQKTEKEPSLMESNGIQLAFLAGLFILFLAMLALLFKRYRTKGKTKTMKRNVSLYGNLWKPESLSFTPNMFSSESSPAILVAHHDDDLRLFITNTLRLNYRVISTSDGEEAFEKAFEMVPDLVITDQNMPGIDGPLLCRRIKLSEVTSHIPIILLSQRSSNQYSLEHWQAYADDHLYYSFDAKELLMRVHQLIVQRKNLQEEYRMHVNDNETVGKYLLPEQPFLFKLNRVLRTYYSDPLFGVEQLTDQLQMSRLQLYRKLKALTTQSPGDFIRYYRIEQAKNILSQDGLPVSEVALKCGFNNQGSFNKAFRDYTGKTPVDFTLQKVTNDTSMVED